jgi:hypothetical protein
MCTPFPYKPLCGPWKKYLESNKSFREAYYYLIHAFVSI